MIALPVFLFSDYQRSFRHKFYLQLVARLMRRLSVCGGLHTSCTEVELSFKLSQSPMQTNLIIIVVHLHLDSSKWQVQHKSGKKI